MSICHCPLPAFGNLEWVAMACLGTLVPKRAFLVLTGSADFVVLAPWAMKNIFVLECPHLQFIRDKFTGLGKVQTMVHFFGQDDLVNPNFFVNVCLAC
jgi:hypothetical protein